MVSNKAIELREEGVREGTVVTLVSSRSIEYLVRYFAIHMAGGVAVPAEEGIPTDLFDEIAARLSVCTVSTQGRLIFFLPPAPPALRSDDQPPGDNCRCGESY